MKKEIENNKKNFILHNIVRLREMIRYLPPEKLTLFKMIPFLIHVNSPDFPGYVKPSYNIKSTSHTKPISYNSLSDSNNSFDNIFGVWNFENSGFAKDIAQSSQKAKELLSINCPTPAVQAIYHIGSLGTFTQSAKSDFDFWVVIEKPEFSKTEKYTSQKNANNREKIDSYIISNGVDNSNFIDMLHEKLALIITYSRKEFSQEVSFFVHYAHNLRNNTFDNPDDEDSVAVPELLLKEEFYRTFIMVAGKIPLWAVQPLGLTGVELELWKKEAYEYGGFIDLGTLESMPIEEIQRGLLWQICKAPYDPVKSVIKASITASYNTNIHKIDSVEHNKKSDSKQVVTPLLLCDMVKERFGKSIIDDYAADPYIIAFERVLQFYTKLGDQKALSQIKAAIFFRLCGFPLVTLPPKESPKRKILDRYINQWQLSQTRLKKLLEYQNWSESEKILFDQTMINRLHLLYKSSLEQTVYDEDNSKDTLNQNAQTSIQNKRESDFTILINKVNKITLKKKGVLPKCSTYLSLKPQTNLILVLRELSKTQIYLTELLLFSIVNNNNAQDIQSQSSKAKKDHLKNSVSKKRYNLLYSARYFMEIIGWSMYNHLYIRGTTHLEMRVPLKLYGSLGRDVDWDDIYLALQPWMPISDEPFLSQPVWEKIVVLLFIDNLKEPHTNNNKESIDLGILEQFRRAEFLVRNSWGEIFFDVISFEQVVENPEEKCYQTAMKIVNYHEKESNYSVFQISSKPLPTLIQKIKTMVEDTKVIKNSSANIDYNKTLIQRRPYLDAI